MADNIKEAMLDYFSDADYKKIISNAAEGTTEFYEDIKKLNKELGSGESVEKFRHSLADLSITTGVSAKSAKALLDITKEYHKSIDESTKSTLLFQKATGASTEIIGKLEAKLSKMSKVSSGVYESMYKNIIAVRDAYGLTSKEIDQVSANLLTYNARMKNVGSTIAYAAKQMSLFTSKLSSAGMEADDISKILDNMMDPSKISEYMMLWNKMGLTISDLTVGDPTAKLEASLPKLKSLGAQIMSSNNRVMQQQMAQMYGISVEQAKSFANLDTSQKATGTKSLWQSGLDVMNLKEIYGSATNRLSGIAPYLMSGLSLFASSKGLGGDFTTGMMGAIGSAFGLNSSKFKKNKKDENKEQAAVNYFSGEGSGSLSNQIDTIIKILINESGEKKTIYEDYIGLKNAAAGEKSPYAGLFDAFVRKAKKTNDFSDLSDDEATKKIQAIVSRFTGLENEALSKGDALGSEGREIKNKLTTLLANDWLKGNLGENLKKLTKESEAIDGLLAAGPASIMQKVGKFAGKLGIWGVVARVAITGVSHVMAKTDWGKRLSQNIAGIFEESKSISDQMQEESLRSASLAYATAEEIEAGKFRAYLTSSIDEVVSVSKQINSGVENTAITK